MSSGVGDDDAALSLSAASHVDFTLDYARLLAPEVLAELAELSPPPLRAFAEKGDGDAEVDGGDEDDEHEKYVQRGSVSPWVRVALPESAKRPKVDVETGFIAVPCENGQGCVIILEPFELRETLRLTEVDYPRGVCWLPAAELPAGRSLPALRGGVGPSIMVSNNHASKLALWQLNSDCTEAVKVREFGTGNQGNELGDFYYPQDITTVFHPDDGRACVAVADGPNNRIQVIDANTGESVKSTPMTWCWGMATNSLRGTILATKSDVIYEIDWVKEKEVRKIKKAASDWVACDSNGNVLCGRSVGDTKSDTRRLVCSLGEGGKYENSLDLGIESNGMFVDEPRQSLVVTQAGKAGGSVCYLTVFRLGGAVKSARKR